MGSATKLNSVSPTFQLIDMVEILFSREKVSLNVSKNKLVRKNAVT